MNDARSRLIFLLCVGALITPLAFPAVSPGADGDGMQMQTGEVGDADVPTGARRAAEWKPSREGLVGEPWEVSALVGFVYFSGDGGVDDQPGFALELRGSHGLASDFYVVGSYLLGFSRTEVTDPDDGSEETDDHVLHIPTLGIGFRAEMNPEIHLFLEPRIGALITDDDIGPVAGASVGVDIALDPGIIVRFAFTGLFADATLDTPAGDADLNAIWSAGIGLAFEF